MNRRTFVRNLLLAPFAAKAIIQVQPLPPSLKVVPFHFQTFRYRANVTTGYVDAFKRMGNHIDLRCDAATGKALNQLMSKYAKRDAEDARALNEFIAKEMS